MASPDESSDDIFVPSGGLRLDLLTEAAVEVLNESVRPGA